MRMLHLINIRINTFCFVVEKKVNLCGLDVVKKIDMGQLCDYLIYLFYFIQKIVFIYLLQFFWMN